MHEADGASPRKRLEARMVDPVEHVEVEGRADRRLAGGRGSRSREREGERND